MEYEEYKSPESELYGFRAEKYSLKTKNYISKIPAIAILNADKD